MTGALAQLRLDLDGLIAQVLEAIFAATGEVPDAFPGAFRGLLVSLYDCLKEEGFESVGFTRCLGYVTGEDGIRWRQHCEILLTLDGGLWSKSGRTTPAQVEGVMGISLDAKQELHCHWNTAPPTDLLGVSPFVHDVILHQVRKERSRIEHAAIDQITHATPARSGVRL